MRGVPGANVSDHRHGQDRTQPLQTGHRYTTTLEYRLSDDRLSFWTGKYPTAGTVMAFMCEGCGRIALYRGKPGA